MINQYRNTPRISPDRLYWPFEEDIDVWWLNDLELCGYGTKSHKYIVIADGFCCSDSGTWVVFGFKLKEPLTAIPAPFKFPSEGYDRIATRLFEKRVVFEPIERIISKYKDMKNMYPDDIIVVRRNEWGHESYYSFDSDAIRLVDAAEGFGHCYYGPKSTYDVFLLDKVNFDWAEDNAVKKGMKIKIFEV